MAHVPVIGACVVPCNRCGQSMRVEVTAELSPIEKVGMHALRIIRRGEHISTCYWRIKPVKSDHRCPGRKPKPREKAA